MPDFDTEETEDVDIITMAPEGAPPGAQFKVGYAPKSRTLYIDGELHPLGAYSAILQASKEHVPYVSLGAVSALFPEEWIKQACQHDLTRLRIIDGIGRALRGTA